MGKVIGLFISERRGVMKEPVEKVKIIENWGIEGDAHAGNWDRQVSVLPIEALDLVPWEKREEAQKGHTENMLIEGIPLEKLEIGKKIKVGDAVLEIKAIGKYPRKEEGRAYIVSREGRFCRVLKGGEVKVGDKVEVLDD